MTIIVVFACKSNSCRSQMAEAWANNWIRTERDDLLRQIKDQRRSEEVKSQIQEKLYLLENIYVFSVALDEATAVKSGAIGALKNDGVNISRYESKTYTTLENQLLKYRLIYPSEEVDGEKGQQQQQQQQLIDKLIILGSCDESLERALIHRSATIEKWNVGSPSYCVHGEDKDSYRQLSLEIKHRVEESMEDIFCDKMCDSSITQAN